MSYPLFFTFRLLAPTRLCTGHARSENLRGSCGSESCGHVPGLIDRQWRCEDARLHVAMPTILAIYSNELVASLLAA